MRRIGHGGSGNFEKSYFKSVDVKSSRLRISWCATKATDPEGAKDPGAQSPSAAGGAGDLARGTGGPRRAAPDLRRVHRAERAQCVHRQHRKTGCRLERRIERITQRCIISFNDWDGDKALMERCVVSAFSFSSLVNPSRVIGDVQHIPRLSVEISFHWLTPRFSCDMAGVLSVFPLPSSFCR